MLRGGTFASLSVPNYRRYFISQFVSQAGNTMQVVAQAWLVLQLSHSGTALGAVTAVQFVPLLLLGSFGGLLADRLERRRIMFVTQSLLALVAAVLALTTLFGQIRLWEVFVLAGCTGVVTAFDNPVKQSIQSDVVPAEQLNNAVTLNSIEVNVARIVGPATGGLIIAYLGVGVCFAFNAVSFLTVLCGLALMRFTGTRQARSTRSVGKGVTEGFRYARHSPVVFLPLLMTAVIGMFAWEFPVTLPLLADRTFDGGPRAYGLMVGVMGVGAVVGGLLTAARKSGLPNLPLACLIWAVPLLLTAVAPTFPIALVCLLFVGYASINFNAMSKTTLQLGSIPEMRGRVMAFWGIAWQGSTPIGGPIVGWIGQQAGARWAIATGGMAALAVGVLTVVPWRAVGADNHYPAGAPEQPVPVAIEE